MICSACGHQSESSAKFCSECGARLSLSCPTCSAAVKEDAKFCSECGAALKVSAASAPETLSVSGEKKHITVLFADVAGSMDLQERLDPEVWAQIMGRFVSILAEGVRKFGGTVDKFTGDGIMALFGAPVAQEDHARRACHAAWHLTKAIGQYSQELQQTQGVELQVRLGLNSGEVVVGRVGDDVTLDPTALGHTVGLAQRMEGLAEPGKAFLTEYTARLVEGWFGLDDLGEMAVKGSRERLPVYVLGPPLSSPVRRRVGASRLVGRERELAVLEDAVAMAGEGHAQVVGVVGEAGVGKSRLCEEFAASAVGRGITVRRTGGVSHGKDVPLLPILALLRDYFGVSDSDAPESAREKVTVRLLALDPDLEEALPLLFDFLEVPDPERPAPKLAPEVRMRRIFQALRRATARRSEREVLVLVFEDLHWFDPQSEAFLERLIESFPGSRTLVVANFRPEFSAAWMHHSYYRQLSLAPLQEQAVRDLVGALVGVNPSLAPLVSLVSERTRGNPFFVEEVVRALIEDGTLAGGPANYGMTRSLHDIRVPPSVQAVLAARIDRLSGDHKVILQTAAVIGRTFNANVLAQVTGSARVAIDDALAALCAADFLQQAGGEGEYQFWHPLTQEVAYQTLLSARRSRLHGAVAQAMIDLEPHRLDEQAALIAGHWQKAGRPFDAAQWKSRAAKWALRTDVSEAVRRLRATIADVEKVSPTEEAMNLAVDARIFLLRWGARTGMDLEEAEQLHLAGQKACESLGDIRRLAQVSWAFGTANFWHGAMRAGTDLYLKAARLADQAGDPRLRAALWAPPAAGCVWTGPVDAGLKAVDKVVTLCGGDPDFGAEIFGYSVLVRTYLSWAELIGLSGQMEEARRIADEGVAMARGRSEPEVLAWMLSIYHRLARAETEMEQALHYGQEAVRIAEETANAAAHVTALAALGIAELGLGRVAAANDTLRRALAEARERQAALFEEATLLVHLARAQAGVGEIEDALRFADGAVDVASRQGSRIVECLALVTRAQVARRAGVRREAVIHDLELARLLVQETGALIHAPFVAEEIGHVLDDETELRNAVRLYSEIGATGQARRLEAELGSRAIG